MGSNVEKGIVFLVFTFAMGNIYFISQKTTKHKVEFWKIKQIKFKDNLVESDTEKIPYNKNLYEYKSTAYTAFLLTFLAYFNDRKICKEELDMLLYTFDNSIKEELTNRKIIIKEELLRLLDVFKVSIVDNDFKYKEMVSENIETIVEIVKSEKNSYLFEDCNYEKDNFKKNLKAHKSYINHANKVIDLAFNMLCKKKRLRKTDIEVMKNIKKEFYYINI